MTPPQYLTAQQLDDVIGGRYPCPACQRILNAGDGGQVVANAITFESPTAAVHAGDVVSGRTLCGANADSWRWAVARRSAAVEQTG